MLGFEVYNGDTLVKILENLGFSAEYHLDKKEHIVVVAKKL